jgi:hypothetical protein
MKNYNYIFWTQNESNLIKDTIIIDGIKTEYNTSSKQDDAVKFLMDIPSRYGLYQELFESCREKLGVSNGFKYYTYKSLGTFLQGCFKECDNEGRPMIFMLWCNTTTTNQVMDILSGCCNMVNRHVMEADLKIYPKMLDEQKKKRIHKKIIIIIISVLLLITILIGIWNP